MDVLGDVLARDRRSAAPALRVPALGRTYDYRRLITTAWKTGNFLRHLGVRRGDEVAIVPEPVPEPLVTFYGTGLLGGVVRFGPSRTVDSDVRVLVVPASDLGDYDVGPTTKRVAFGDAPDKLGDAPDEPSVSCFERDVWSENPTAPPERVRSDHALLRTSGSTHSHGEVLAAAESARNALPLGPGVVVEVEGPVADPEVIAGGFVAPLLAGGTIAVGPGGDGDVSVGEWGGDSTGFSLFHD